MSETGDTHKEAKAQAKAAKAYAKASRPWFKKKRVWLLGVIVLAAISSSMGGGDKSSDSSSSETAAVAETPIPAVKVTATQLISDLERLRGPTVLLGNICALIFSIHTSIYFVNVSSNFKK